MKCNRTERKSNSTNSKRQSPKTNKKSVKVDLILWVEQRETSLVLRDCMKLPHGTFFNFFFSWGLYCLHFDLLVLRCSQQQIKTSQQSKAKLLSNQMLWALVSLCSSYSIIQSICWTALPCWWSAMSCGHETRAGFPPGRAISPSVDTHRDTNQSITLIVVWFLDSNEIDFPICQTHVDSRQICTVTHVKTSFYYCVQTLCVWRDWRGN